MLLIKGAHVVDPQIGLDGVMDVLIEGERIARVGERIKAPEGAEVIEADGKYLVPGLTDIHVHFRDPGFEYKETIETGSAAAAATPADATPPHLPSPSPPRQGRRHNRRVTGRRI